MDFNEFDKAVRGALNRMAPPDVLEMLEEEQNLEEQNKRNSVELVYNRGFSVADSVRYICLMTQDDEVMSEDYCLAEMKKISDKYPGSKKI